MKATASDLQGRRGEIILFSTISFSLSAGQALLLTGPNGSGKSTLIRILAGLLPADNGRFEIRDSNDAPLPVGEAAHYLGHRNAMKRELSVKDNLGFWKTFQSGSDERGLTPLEAVSAVGLDGIAHLPFGYLSAGQQRRIALARLLLNWRPLWMLDEPTAALDKASDALFSRLVANHLEAGGMAIAATHLPLGFANAKTLELDGRKRHATGEAA